MSDGVWQRERDSRQERWSVRESVRGRAKGSSRTIQGEGD